MEAADIFMFSLRLYFSNICSVLETLSPSDSLKIDLTSSLKVASVLIGESYVQLMIRLRVKH